MFLYDEGLRYEISEDECDFEPDGSGFWVEDEDGDSDSFYEFCDDEGDE